MKITNRLFSYPVLCSDKDDYESCIFDVNVKNENDISSIKMSFNIDMNCEEIQNLINAGDAEYMIHFECASTAFRTAIRSSLPTISFSIPINKVNGFIERVAFVICARDIKDFKCTDWNQDFGEVHFDLKKGTILAYQNLPKLDVQKNYEEFSNASSMFRICKRPIDEESPFDVLLDSDYIQIYLNAKEYELYTRYYKKTEMQPILNSMIILPTLVYVFEELRQDKTQDESFDYSRWKWYNALVKTYQKRGSDLSEVLDSDKKSIELAQDVMEFPISKAFSNIPNIYETSIGDD